jgi:hypothetical protein
MKRTDRLKKEAEKTMDKIRSLTRHIRNVEDNCLFLGERLIENGEIDLGRQLIANGYVHDASKFFGIEFEYLAYSTSAKEDDAKLKQKIAIQNHRCINKHHPEAWSGGIKDMPDVHLAEFCCDSKARSEEFGTDLRKWIDEEATKRYGFTVNDKVYKDITKYIDILCPKPFENVQET